MIIQIFSNRRSSNLLSILVDGLGPPGFLERSSSRFTSWTSSPILSAGGVGSEWGERGGCCVDEGEAAEDSQHGPDAPEGANEGSG